MAKRQEPRTRIGKTLQAEVRRVINLQPEAPKITGAKLRYSPVIPYSFSNYSIEPGDSRTAVHTELDPWRIVVRYAGTDIVELQPLEDYPCHLWRVTVNSGGKISTVVRDRIQHTLWELCRTMPLQRQSEIPSCALKHKQLTLHVPADNETVSLNNDWGHTFIQSI